MSQIGGSGCLELCLYGIRELAYQHLNQIEVITLKAVAMVWIVVVFGRVPGEMLTVRSEIETAPGSLQTRSNGDGIGPLIFSSRIVLKVSLEL